MQTITQQFRPGQCSLCVAKQEKAQQLKQRSQPEPETGHFRRSKVAQPRQRRKERWAKAFQTPI